ncbi:hypothetical protein SNK04_014227 [Fusarium graminearum]
MRTHISREDEREAIANWDERARRAGIEAPAVVRMVAAEVAPAGAASVELPPTTPTEAAAIVEQRLTTLDELSRQDRLTPSRFQSTGRKTLHWWTLSAGRNNWLGRTSSRQIRGSESAVRNSTR